VQLRGPVIKKLALPAILAYAIAFRLVALDRPFHYDDEATGGSFYGIAARNYLRWPWTGTHGIPVLTVGRLAGVPLIFYPDHPPVVPLLIFPMYRMFGVGEWQTRLPTSVATVVAIGILYRLMRRFGNGRTALVAAAVFAATPMVLYFGGQPEVLGMPLVLCALLTVYAYLTFHREGSRAAFARLLGAFTLAAASDWPAFILVPVLVAHFAATRPRREWGWMLMFGAVASVEFALLYIGIAAAANLPWDWMVPLVKGRAALGITAPFTARDWLWTAWIFNRHCHTLPLVVAAAAWVALHGAGVVPRAQPGATAARLLLVWGVLHVLIGRQGVYNHEWWWWPLTPGLAAAAALLADATLNALERRGSTPARPAWPLPSAALILAVTAFAAWTTVTEYRQLYPSSQGDDSFTTLQLGRAIQAAAPGPNDLAMLAWSGEDPELWFYGDRPLRTNIWTVDDFLASVSGPEADLAFGYPQPWPARATGIVLPLVSIGTTAGLRAYLATRYPVVRLPRDLAEQFEVFDLRQE
jgi:Dolichyl-phosphate-mannose-protein mannosyltransferase